MTETAAKRNIAYSCYHKESRQGEQFVADHALTYQIAGMLTLTDGKKSFVSDGGSLILVQRNNLLKFTKTPPVGGDFESLSLHLDQELLKEVGTEYNFKAISSQKPDEAVSKIKITELTRGFIGSLIAYHHSGNLNDEKLVRLKMKEAVLIILKAQPSLRHTLFSFVDPHKINLEAFMNKNFHFNVHLDRFAYLTGRSLASFKRDFIKIYNTTPGKWLQNKRLQEAHFQIRERGKHPSDIYLDLGFEDLSHFSYAFKKKFGEAPSMVLR